MPLSSTFTFTSLNCFLSSLLWISLATLSSFDTAGTPHAFAIDACGRARSAKANAATDAARHFALWGRLTMLDISITSSSFCQILAARVPSLHVWQVPDSSGILPKQPNRHRMPSWVAKLCGFGKIHSIVGITAAQGG